MSFTFEWDDEKAKVNERDHGVSFEEAIEVFDDEFALEEYDVAHSKDENPLTLSGFQAAAFCWLCTPSASEL